MISPKFIDIHTHTKSNQPDTIEILVHTSFDSINLDDNFCYGIHPWFLAKEKANISKIKDLSSKESFYALGEIGLDRLTNNYEEQIQYFQLQIDLANQLRIPRIIIHNVRAFDDIYKYLKKLSYRPKILFHAYQGNLMQVEQLSKFNSYFSFGIRELKKKGIKKVLTNISPDKWFLETDDSGELIQTVYEHASQLTSIPLESLKVMLFRNYKVF